MYPTPQPLGTVLGKVVISTTFTFIPVMDEGISPVMRGMVAEVDISMIVKGIADLRKLCNENAKWLFLHVLCNKVWSRALV